MEEVKKEHAVYAHVYDGVPFYIGSGRIYKTTTGLLRGRPYQLNFKDRSPQWWEFCNGEKDKIEVKILFVTDDEKLSLDFEAEITRMYMEAGFPLANVNIGIYHGEESRIKIGEGNKGKILSEEQKRTISEALKGRKHDEETKQKMSETRKGKKFSEEHRKNMSKAAKRRASSEEYRNKMSESRKGEKNPMAKKVLVTNNKTREQINFLTIQNAHKFIVEKGYPYKYVTFYKYINKGLYNFENYTMELA